ncbi:MAG: DNA polymerase/3'-5' exonuclease PolX [Elusimicrobia bacterium]|nr:DNA polymerase/3'-5' exonuclease PolX [Elusimicrobiota bacterium]
MILSGNIQSDLRVVSEAQYAFALAYFTGSKAHNIALRGRALRLKGLSLNEYGFSPAAHAKGKSAKELGSSIACRDEAAIYRALDLPHIPPELREDMGELEAAEQGRLPELVTDKDIRGTFHCHTDWSDGLADAETMAKAALARGWSYLGLADHSVSQRQAHGLDARRARAQIALWRRLREKFARKGLRLFLGTECDILPDGSLDFDDRTLALFDYVVAAVHSGFSMERKAMTRRILKALENPRVTMLAHPTGRLLLQRDPYAVDLDAVLKAAARRGVYMEINAHPMRLDLDWRQLQRATELGARCVINPDAHDADGLDAMPFGVRIARKGWLTRKDLINCLDAGQVAKALVK